MDEIRKTSTKGKMKYIECPAVHLGKEKSIFLAGGITACADWQKEMVELLSEEEIVLLNPRRADFNANNPNMSLKQITWEHSHLNKASAILFWFSHETLCPITLYELGKWTAKGKKIFIGIHPEYKRKFDVEYQTKLERPEIDIVYDLQSLANQVKYWINSRGAE